MNVYIFEDDQALNLEPITLTRPAFELRCGAFTCIERINLLLPDVEIHFLVRQEMAALAREVFPGSTVNPEQIKDGIWLLGNVLWDHDAIMMIRDNEDVFFTNAGKVVGASLTAADGQSWQDAGGPQNSTLKITSERRELKCTVLNFLWDAIAHFAAQLSQDAAFFSDYQAPVTVATLVAPDNIFAHETAVIAPGAVIDASSGPVIIAENVVVKPLAYIGGPLYLGAGCSVEPMTLLKGPNGIGPVCKLGGELHNVIIQGYSNKVHEGHLGDAYLGQWVNLGAGTTNSNLKNNYSDVVVMVNDDMRATGSKFIGCFIGDYVKTAIGTLLTTGTVIGPGSMIATHGFPSKTIAPFSWCIEGKTRRTKWSEFLATTKKAKSRRELDLSTAETELLETIYHQ